MEVGSGDRDLLIQSSGKAALVGLHEGPSAPVWYRRLANCTCMILLERGITACV